MNFSFFFLKEFNLLELNEVLDILEVFDFLLLLWGGVSWVMIWVWGLGFLVFNRVWIFFCNFWVFFFKIEIRYNLVFFFSVVSNINIFISFFFLLIKYGLILFIVKGFKLIESVYFIFFLMIKLSLWFYIY